MKAKILLSFFIAFFVYNTVFSQKDKAGFKPYYVTFTKLHGFQNIDKEEWKKVEIDFFNKVTKKNPYILHYEFLYNYYKDESPDYIIMKVFKTWDDIDKAYHENKRLISKAWSDPDERSRFFEEQNKFYDLYFSNEIFTSAPLAQFLPESNTNPNTKQKLFYILYDKLADYDNDDSLDAYQQYIENVTYKNPYVKSYYAQKHYVGHDSRDFYQIFVVDSYEDLIKSFNKDKELLKNMIPDENERIKFIDLYNKGVERVRNGVYKNIPEISK
jgi:hypothetical protein